MTKRTVQKTEATEAKKPKRAPQKVELKDGNIGSFKPPKTGHTIWWDTKTHSTFGLRITANGARSFVLDYRLRGRQRRYTLGRWPELTLEKARSKASALRDQIKDDKNPTDPMETRQQERHTDPTVKNLASDYLTRYAEPKKKASSLRDDRAMLDTIILPHFGQHEDKTKTKHPFLENERDTTRRLPAVGRRDIEVLHAKLKHTPYRANRVLSLLSKMFNLAVAWEWIAKSPVKGIERYNEPKRTKWLTVEQLQRLREGLDAYEDQHAADCVRLLMYSGCRMGESLSATWDEFDLNAGTWEKPSHHTKTKTVETIPLNGPTLELLRRMRPKKVAAGQPLFAGKEKKNDTEKRSRTTIRNPWVQICRAAGLVEETTVKKGKRKGKIRYRPTVSPHTLRHSFASQLVQHGVGLQVVGKLMGHTQLSTTARYGHLANEALKSATDVFGDILAKAEKEQKGA